MKIALDGFGGDNAPIEILKGAALARKEYKIDIVVTGKTEKMKKIAADNGISLEGIELAEASEVMTAEDEAKTVLKQKSDSSMAVALKMVAEGLTDAVVTAGPTGAFLMGATMIVKRIKGVKRPALGAVMPGLNNPFILIDCGANAEVRPEMLEQFGMMGSVYMKNILGVENPRAAIANNGAEEGKGTDLQRNAYNLMRDNKAINFIGNIEGREIPEGNCEVVVTDGFTGNIILKTIEGMAASMFTMLKDVMLGNMWTKTAAMMLKPGLKQLKSKTDYTEYGGAPLIGLRKPVVKAHGSSDANAIKNAVRQAVQWSESGIIAEIEAILAEIPASDEE